MKKRNIMLKPASSMCNLRCRYCFYADVVSNRSVPSYGVMSEATADAVLVHVFSDLEDGDAVTFAFQGGEPTLAGLPFFRHFVERVRQQNPRVQVDYALQTNGTLLDEAWCAFLRENRVLVGVSLDGTAANHDRCRVDAQGRGTHRQVMAAIRLLKEHGVAYNVLMTLTNSMARHPRQMWRFLKEHRMQYVQFTPCLAPLEGGGARDVYALTPRRFADFYRQLFTLWYVDWEQGIYTSVKLFDDLIRLLAFGEVNACGMTGSCMPQIVVEADGSVYPCDFYMLDRYRAGDLTCQSLRTLDTAPRMLCFRSEEREHSLCGACLYRRLCGGGCKRMQQSVCYSPGDSVCGYRLFLDDAMERLCRVAGGIRRRD